MRHWQGSWVSLTAMVGGVLVAGLFAARPPAGAVSREDFVAKTTAEYVAVCSTPESDPLYLAAMAFCQGYGVGAGGGYLYGKHKESEQAAYQNDGYQAGKQNQ
jgi:hypothetical protein